MFLGKQYDSEAIERLTHTINQKNEEETKHIREAEECFEKTKSSIAPQEINEYIADTIKKSLGIDVKSDGLIEVQKKIFFQKHTEISEKNAARYNIIFT